MVESESNIVHYHQQNIRSALGCFDFFGPINGITFTHGRSYLPEFLIGFDRQVATIGPVLRAGAVQPMP